MEMEKGERLEKYGNMEVENSQDLEIDWIHMTCQTSLLFTYIKWYKQMFLYIPFFYFSLVLLSIYILNSYLSKLQLDGD